MRTWEVSDDAGKVVLEIGDTKGGLTIIHLESLLEMTPTDARDLGEELIRVAEVLDAARTFANTKPDSGK